MWSLAFKPDTDNLRENPLVTLTEILSENGVKRSIYDKLVQVIRLIGGNNTFIEQTLLHLAKLLVKTPGDLDDCEQIALGQPTDSNLLHAWLEHGKHSYDPSGMKNPPDHPHFRALD